MCRGCGLELADMTIKHCDKLVSVEIAEGILPVFSRRNAEVIDDIVSGMFSNSIIDILTVQ